MTPRAIAVAVAAGLITLVPAAIFLWGIFGPSVIRLQNVGDEPAWLILTDADHATRVWSGELRPNGRKTIMVWFRHEGSPELRCRDHTSSTEAPLGYVTSHMPINAEIAISGCDRIDQRRS